MTGAPARTVAAMPAIHAASSFLNTCPTATAPPAATPKPSAESCSAGGSESTKSSMLAASHGSGSMPCSWRTMLVLPELDPPLTTITLGTTVRTYATGARWLVAKNVRRSPATAAGCSMAA